MLCFPKCNEISAIAPIKKTIFVDLKWFKIIFSIHLQNICLLSQGNLNEPVIRDFLSQSLCPMFLTCNVCWHSWWSECSLSISVKINKTNLYVDTSNCLNSGVACFLFNVCALKYKCVCKSVKHIAWTLFTRFNNFFVIKWDWPLDFSQFNKSNWTNDLSWRHTTIFCKQAFTDDCVQS